MFNKLLKRLFQKRKVTDDLVEEISVKVWNVTSGPYHRDEIDDPHLPEELEYMLVCLVEIDGELANKEYWFSSLKDATVWVDHFKNKIEPIKVAYE
jgi:hypothetical protein